MRPQASDVSPRRIREAPASAGVGLAGAAGFAFEGKSFLHFQFYGAVFIGILKSDVKNFYIHFSAAKKKGWEIPPGVGMTPFASPPPTPLKESLHFRPSILNPSP